MIKLSTKFLFFFSIITFFTTSCKVAQTSMEVLRPADIDVPQHIKKVAVANRSLPGKGDRLASVLEALVSGEQIFADREGSTHCVNGLVAQLNNAPRFTAVQASNSTLFGTGTRQFAPALSWKSIDSICTIYSVDAVILLETFDSNTGIKESSKDVKRTKDGQTYYEKVFRVDLCLDVNSGWRIYDNVNKRIIDQNSYIDGKCFVGEGPNTRAARQKLPAKRQAINQAGYYSGQQYGKRISPNWIRVSRAYFVKGNGFKDARKQIRFQNWDAAEQIWDNMSKSADRKIAGRAFHNLALANEMKGDLNNAIKYAERASKEFHIKQSRSYLVVLQRRKADEHRLDTQLRDN